MIKNNFKRIFKNPEVVFVKLPYKTETIYFNIFIKDIIFLESEKDIGLAHFWEHCLLTIIHNKFRDAFNINGNVGISGLEFFFEFQSQSDYKYIKEILSIIFTPISFEESIFNREKRVILDEIENSSSNTLRKLFILSLRSFFENPGRLNYPIYGTSEKVKSYSFEQFLNFWKKIINSNKLIKIFIGSYYLSSNLEKDLSNFFSNLKFSNEKLPQIKFKYSKTNIVIENWQFDQKLNVVLNFPGENVGAPLKNKYAESALCRLITKSFEYGIFDDLRNLGVYSFDWMIFRTFYFGIISFKIKCNKENIYEAVRILIKKILAFKKSKIPFKNIQNQFDLEYLKNSWKTNSKFFNWVVEDLIDINRVFSPQRVISTIKSLTSRDIKKTAQRFNFKNASLIIIGNNAVKLINKRKLFNLIKNV